MWRIILYLCLHGVLSMNQCLAQHVLFYNVENLFDTLHDRGKNDHAFTPNGGYEYNTPIYYLKIRQTARAIRSSINTVGQNIDIIALAEVENRSVLIDLAKHKAIAGYGPWQVVHYDSPDHRGIDCAALINTSTTRVVTSHPIAYSSAYFKSRDALLLQTKSASDEDSITLTCAIVHLPSKRGGAVQSAPLREQALKAVVKQLEKDTNQNQLILGDFNDLASADWFQNHLKNGWSSPEFSYPKNILGSYKYQGRWQHIDLALYRGSNPFGGTIIAPPILLEIDAKWGGYKPKRSFLGRFYTFGYSDHLPVYIFNVIHS
jgi:predicted extracellular nuclease